MLRSLAIMYLDVCADVLIAIDMTFLNVFYHRRYSAIWDAEMIDAGVFGIVNANAFSHVTAC